VVESGDATTWVDLGSLLVGLGALAVAGAVPLTRHFRAPSLTLHEDTPRLHSHVEGNGLPYVRLVVRNKGWRRVARQARLFAAWYAEQGLTTSPLTMGSPELSWTSLVRDDALVFPAGERPVDLGILFPATRDNFGQLVESHPDDDAETIIKLRRGEWQFKFALAHNLLIVDRREFVPPTPNGYVVRVELGAEEGPARRYDVHVNWDGKARDAQAALDSVQLAIERV
jgi:hypothetical protein